MAIAPRRVGDPPSGGEVARPVSFGRYDLLFRIASGGMAEVHAGRVRGEAGFEKLVAIKRMHAHLAEDTHFVDMFLDEARVASNVASPYVVQTLDLGRADDGSLFLVLELVIGQALSGLLRTLTKNGETMPLPIALEVLAQAAQGLDDAHEAMTPTGLHLGIVHRDVSPQNLLVGIDGRTRVTDFGIARALLRRTSTSTGELKGKIAYFSPEQANATDVDRRSDVFALGIVAWEAVTGRRLFNDGEALLTLRRLIEESVPNPRTVKADLPVSVAQVILRSLSRDPAGRWQTAGEMATALREAGAELGRPPTAREIGKWVSSVGGEKLRSIRERIDAAMSDTARDGEDDAPTRLLGSGPGEPSSGIVSRPVDSAISIDLVPDSLPGSARIPPPVPSAPIAQVSTNVTTAPSLDLPVPNAGGRGKMVVFGLVGAAALGAIFLLGRASSNDKNGVAPVTTTSAPSPERAAPSAEPTTSATPAKSAEIAVSAPSAFPKNVRPGKSIAPKSAAPDQAAPVATIAPPAAKTADPVAPPATTPAPKTGPLLGDDAFNRDVSRKN